MDKDQAVIAVAKEEIEQGQPDNIRTLTTGVRVRTKTVAPGLISRAQMAIEWPKVPKFHNPDKDRWEENENHPDYIAEVARVREERGMAALDAMCMFGLELVDGVPDGDEWIRRIRFVLPGLKFDESDPLEREYYYKTLVAVGVQDFAMLAKAMGVSEEALAQAEDSFQRNTPRNNNRPAPAQTRRKQRN